MNLKEMQAANNFNNALGNPFIIADCFHIMRQVYWVLDGVRREVQKELSKTEHIRMKHSEKLLCKLCFSAQAGRRRRFIIY
ncbi:transposase [Lederbergia ruris]|uniref:transposase n=1 Tax=Lederbergia ruris TaxID=217495 RepID=UPI0039A1DC8B